MGPFVPVPNEDNNSTITTISFHDDYENLLNQLHTYRIQINRARNELRELQTDFYRVKNLINSQAYRDEVYRQELRRRKWHFYLLIFLVQLVMMNVCAVWVLYGSKRLVDHRRRVKFTCTYRKKVWDYLFS